MSAGEPRSHGTNGRLKEPARTIESVAPEASAEMSRDRRAALVYPSLALLVIDVAMVSLGFLVGYHLRFDAGVFVYDEYQPLRAYFGAFALQIAIAPAVFATNGRYRPARSASLLDHLYGVFVDISVATALAIVFGAFLGRDNPFSRLMMALVWASAILFVTIGRVLVFRVSALLRRRGVGEERVLIVGSGEAARVVADRIKRSPESGYRTIGFLAESEEALRATIDPNVLGVADGGVGNIVRASGADTIIIAAPSLPTSRLLDIISQCNLERVNIKVYPDLFQLMTSGVNISDLNGLPLVSVKDVALRGWNLVLKRGLDLVVSAIALVLLSPLFLVVAGIVKLTSRGGAFYCQERVGLDGQPFQVIKFRTMRVDAEVDSGPVWARSDDPRRTSIGTFLRRTSLDELPQLINVLIGEMSLVGPRPERPYFVEQFRQTVPRYFERHREKAGVTGWAQVNGLRGNTSIEERTAYDLWYVENWTLWLDIKILLKTIAVVIKDENAY